MASADYQQLRNKLRQAYDGAADRRDRKDKPPWKLAERAAFLRRLQQANCRRMLEIGAGTGQDGVFFVSHGLDVVATDISAAMVARCRDKGLDARVMDFSQLDFPAESFDAVHAMNCLLHVPNAELPAVLASIVRVLRPGGLFFLGVYGASEQAEEGPAESDDHFPARFFSWRTDDQIAQFASESFEIVDFHIAQAGTDQRFQSLTLRRPILSPLLPGVMTGTIAAGGGRRDGLAQRLAGERGEADCAPRSSPWLPSAPYVVEGPATDGTPGLGPLALRHRSSGACSCRVHRAPSCDDRDAHLVPTIGPVRLSSP
jgi:SAM-dependent methyltransferase